MSKNLLHPFSTSVSTHSVPGEVPVQYQGKYPFSTREVPVQYRGKYPFSTSGSTRSVPGEVPVQYQRKYPFSTRGSTRSVPAEVPVQYQGKYTFFSRVIAAKVKVTCHEGPEGGVEV